MRITSAKTFTVGAPWIGIDLDCERLGDHPARRGNRIRLFEPGWELRRSADDE